MWRMDSRLKVLWLVWLGVVIGVVAVLLAPHAHAQSIGTLTLDVQPGQAYITADPIGTDQYDQPSVGLATQAGRFQVELTGPICDHIAVGQNVNIVGVASDGTWLNLEPAGGGDYCQAKVAGYMDATRCFTNGAGVCDVALDPQ